MEVIEKLKELYPSGLILGSAQGIVGELGLTIMWCNRDNTKGMHRLNENETVSIVEIIKSRLLVSVKGKLAEINSNHLKGFSHQLNKRV